MTKQETQTFVDNALSDYITHKADAWTIAFKLTDMTERAKLDAFKDGMSEAAEIIGSNWNGKDSNYCKLIETARDNKTSI